MLKNFVVETTNAPGTTVNVNLAGAISGRNSFAQAFSSGVQVFYFMDDGTQAEAGIGTFTAGSPNVLSRATVLWNTSGTTSRLNFSGSTRVYNYTPAERAVYKDASGNVSLPADLSAAGSLAVAGTAAVTGLASLNGGARIPNAVALQMVDLSGTAHNVLTMFPDNTVNMSVAGGVAWRVLDQAETTVLFSVDNTGNATLKGAFSSGGSITATDGTQAASLLPGGGVVVEQNGLSPGLASFISVGTGQIGSITGNGAGGVAYNTTSDHRLKATFGRTGGGEIGRIAVYDAEFNAIPGVRRPMLLAHELAEVAPWAVTGVKDATDADGRAVYQMVDYTALLPALIAYAQSLEGRITQLEGGV